MTENQQVSEHIQTGAGEIIRLVATLMLFGGAGAIGWAVAHTGYAELAGSGFAVMLVTATKLMWKRGLIGSGATTATEDGLGETRSAMRRIAAEWSAVVARASVLVIVGIAFAYAVAFLALREAVIRALVVFQNPWIAGGCAAIAGAFVVMPTLFPTIAAAMKSSKPVPVPAPAPPVQPTYPTTAPAAPTAPTAPTIVRLKKKKESNDA